MPDSASRTLIPERLPIHVGIIMDGNGRWARQRNLNRTAGHREGLKATKAIVKTAANVGIKYLSLYTFSTENWKRAQEEVSFLMGLVHQHLRREYDFYRENGIRIRHSGDLSGLPPEVQEDIRTVIQDTASHKRLTVNLAINYGGKNEIVRAVRSLIQKNPNLTSEQVTEDSIAQYLDNPDIPDLDLIIRTAGELRLSNFLLWESAYAELYFSPKLWPDFTPDDFLEALLNYQSRNRKFGGVT
ncbi:MAG: polyprenyl diphosphate synthase [Spirochaetes bacterium]|nr:polyprenyl diphosphate synthase [Spirochaetota bacterium]